MKSATAILSYREFSTETGITSPETHMIISDKINGNPIDFIFGLFDFMNNPNVSFEFDVDKKQDSISMDFAISKLDLSNNVFGRMTVTY